MDTNLYWVPHQDLAYIPASLLPLQQYVFKAKSITGEEFAVDTTPQFGQPQLQRDSRGVPFLPVHETSLSIQENLLNLSELTEQAMLHQLRLRFQQNEIYTWISSILVSVNPFKNIPHLYTDELMTGIDSKVRAFQPDITPHVYTIGSQAYLALQQSSYVNSSVIISGESGSGKTLCNSLLLSFFSKISDSTSNDATSKAAMDTISSKIISTSAHILEAFGNAKTSRNNNSSRFGKYIRLYFTSGAHHLCGASIESYLLEKSRITTMIEGERNYHIFYQLLDGLTAEEKRAVHLDPNLSSNELAALFPSLQGSTVHSVDQWLSANSSPKEREALLGITGFDDKSDWAKTRAGLLNYFDQTQLNNMVRVLVGLLYLGQITFEQNPTAHSDACQLTPPSAPIVDKVAELLALDKDIFLQSLLFQKIQMGKELVRKTKNTTEATASVRAAIRTIYDQQFSWLIQQTNASLAPDAKQYPSYAKTMSTIGLLDIFGFEDFKILNSFEQFLINFTNEKMQRFFNNYVFEIELAEYRQEQLDIDLSTITYTNNLPCLDLIETGATSILEMINDELRVPKGTDMTLLEKLVKTHDGRNKYFGTSKLQRNTFTIQHYAGNVQYTIDGWLYKSKDDLQLDLAKNFTLSNIPHLRILMTDYCNTRSGPTKSLGLQFKSQLHELVTMLFNSQPYFIRCIKSNNLLKGGLFDSNMVLTQMNYLGLQSLVSIRQIGYPLRLTYDSFIQRYTLLQLGDDAVTAAQLQSTPFAKKQNIVKTILQRVDPNGIHWKVGETKVFYRNNVQNVLEKMRQDELEQQTIYLQTYIKTTLVRNRYLKLLATTKQMEDFFTFYDNSVHQMQFDDISYAKLAPQITQILAQAERLQISYKPDALSTPSKRQEVLLLRILLVKARLQEQEDSVDFLERSILSNNKAMLINAMFEVQSTHIFDYLEDRPQIGQDTKFNPLVKLDDSSVDLHTQDYWADRSFCSKPVAQLYQNALKVYKALDDFDQLLIQTKEERTLELALQCINDAKYLGLEKSILTECEQLYKVISHEVAEKERKRQAELEARRQAELEEKRQRDEAEREQERIRKEEERLRKEEEKRKREEDRLAERNRKLVEQAQLEEAGRAAAAASGQEYVVIAGDEGVSTPSTPATSSIDEPEEALQPTTPQPNRPIPDYNRINHFIETSNDEQLCIYLSQFLPDPFLHQSTLSRAELIELSTQFDKTNVNRQHMLQFNSYHAQKPYMDSLPIVDAIMRGDVECVEVLIEFGANINVITKSGFTPLATAIKNGKYAMAITLIQKFNCAVSRYDANEETGNCLGHVLAQSLATLLQKFSPSRAQHFIPLLKLILDTNNTVIYNVPNKAGHSAAQFFKKIIKSGPAGSLSGHTSEEKKKDAKSFDTAAFLDEVRQTLFENDQ